MKLGFNEGCNRFCENQSVLEDLALCEAYGFDCIDVQSECLDRDLAAGRYTLEELGAFFRTHKLKMLSYNALVGFNMKRTQAEKDAVLAQLDEIIRRCQVLDCHMIVVVPSMDLTVPATLDDIKADAVAVLREMVKKAEPYGIKLSLEFCGCPTMSINRFEDAYAIVEEVNHPLVGVTLEETALQRIAAGDNLALVYPREGTSCVPDGTALIAGAPHRENAEKFLDFTLSREVQQLLGSRFYRRSVRSDVAAANSLPAMETLNLVDYDPRWAAEHRETILRQWDEALED